VTLILKKEKINVDFVDFYEKSILKEYIFYSDRKIW